MYRILISGYYGFNNIGDESILRTVVENLKENLQDVEITIMSQNPADTAEKYGVKAISRKSVSEIIKAVRSCDLLISGGGSLLQDVTSNKSILYYLFVIRTALFFRKKVVLYSQGIGPINEKRNRRLTSKILKKVDEIAVRDEASARLLQEIGVPQEKISVTADPVMRIKKAELETGAKILEDVGCRNTEERIVVGWAIKSADMSSEFLDEIEKSVQWLHENYNAESVLIPFHYEQDAGVAKALAERMGDRVHSITRKYLSGEMLSIIGNLDYLVGVRLHSLIFAAVMGVPSIAISYDPKIDAFMESISGKCMSDTKNFTAEKFSEAFKDTMERRDEIIAVTAERSEELVERLNENDEMIKRVLDTKSKKASKKEAEHCKAAADVKASDSITAQQKTANQAYAENCKSSKASDQSEPEKAPVSSEDTVQKSENTEPEDNKKPAKNRKKGGIAAAIGSVMMITILAKVFGILRESVQANVFGAADAFYASYNKTIYLYTTVAYAMCIAAVPVITKELEAGRQRGIRAANNLTTFSLIIAVIGMLIWEAVTLEPVAGILFDTSLDGIIPFMRIMALTLPVIVLTYLLVAVFQSMDHFALQGSMSLPYSLFLIAYLVIAAEKNSITVYVAAVAAAWLLQFAMTVPYAVKERYIYRPVIDFRQGYIKDFTKTALVTIVTSSAYLFCYLIDASHAENLGAGTTSAFYYADKLFTPVTTTFIYSISAVMFPKLNREYTKSDRHEYMKYVWGITSNTLILVFPVCVILMVFGEPIITVLFESGNFTAEATKDTTEIFTMYILGMAGFSVTDLLNKAFFTMNRQMVPLITGIGIIGINFVLDEVFSMSGPMLAVSTALSMTAGALITIFVMFRGEKIVKAAPLVKSAAASAVIGAGAYFLKNLLVFDTDGKIMLVLKCGSIGIAAFAVFILLCFVLRIEEITGVISRKLRKS